MSNLLVILRHRPNALDLKTSTPLMVEVEGISPDTAPYLVSASKESWLWVEAPHPDNRLKAGTRTLTTPGDVFLEIVKELARRGQSDGWGNGFEFTEVGVKAAIERARYYDLPDPEILIARLRDETHPKGPASRPDWLTPKTFGCAIRVCSWLPADLAVVVPKDRGYLGTLGYVPQGYHWVVVHNASRGLSFAGNPLL